MHLLPRRALAWLSGLGLAAFGILAVSGWWLSTHYRPAPSVRVDDHQLRSVPGGGWVHELHVGTSVALAVLTAAALLAVAINGMVRWRGPADLVRLAAMTVVTLATALCLWSSRHLRWAYIGLWAVTVGSNVRGIWPIATSHATRFVAVFGVHHEVERTEYWQRVLTHEVAAPALLVANWLLAFVVVGRDR